VQSSWTEGAWGAGLVAPGLPGAAAARGPGIERPARVDQLAEAQTILGGRDAAAQDGSHLRQACEVFLDEANSEPRRSVGHLFLHVVVRFTTLTPKMLEASAYPHKCR